jgi:hypothetical protein
MSAQPNANSRPRKQLSDQLDRLDEILDLLADGLNAAVFEAVKESSERAFRGVALQFAADTEQLENAKQSSPDEKNLGCL